MPPEITKPQLTATLQQAAGDLFSPGRTSKGGNQLTIRARALVHPKPGVSEVVVLGQVQRSLSVREDANMNLDIFDDQLAQLPQVDSNES